jgi:hypothetical protein
VAYFLEYVTLFVSVVDVFSRLVVVSLFCSTRGATLVVAFGSTDVTRLFAGGLLSAVGGASGLVVAASRATGVAGASVFSGALLTSAN